jgi:hypothetical protein
MAITDNFTRADGDVGANWTAANGSADVVSNHCEPHDGTAPTIIYWAANSFTADQSAQFTIAARTNYTGLGVCLQGTGASCSGYYFYMDAGGGGQLRRIDSLSVTGLVVFSGVADGDTVKLARVGDDLEIFINGVSAVSTTDATYHTGAPGLVWAAGSPGRAIDDFVATGEVASGPTIPVFMNQYRQRWS